MFERLWQSVSWLLRLLPGGGRREARSAWLVVGRGEGGVTKQGGAAAAAHKDIGPKDWLCTVQNTAADSILYILYNCVSLRSGVAIPGLNKSH